MLLPTLWVYLDEYHVYMGIDAPAVAVMNRNDSSAPPMYKVYHINVPLMLTTLNGVMR